MRYGTEDRIKQLQAEIDQLRAEPEAPPVWVPDLEGLYYVADNDEVSEYDWRGDAVDKYYLKAGNLFKTKQQAEDYARALNLIETIRRERFRAQGHWFPNEYEARFAVCWNQLGNSFYIGWSFSSDVFGFWRCSDLLGDVAKKHESELEWYFTVYLPSIN